MIPEYMREYEEIEIRYINNMIYQNSMFWTICNIVDVKTTRYLF